MLSYYKATQLLLLMHILLVIAFRPAVLVPRLSLG